jgi:hypothetical protein
MPDQPDKRGKHPHIQVRGYWDELGFQIRLDTRHGCDRYADFAKRM